jgi:dUTP pyrophosphatase
MYLNHSTFHEGDSGLDLFIPNDTVIPAGKMILVNLEISCQLLKSNVSREYLSYNMYSRSSISKTPLMLANGVGLCDQGYLGPLFAALRNLSTEDFTIKRGERYVQLARPDLGEISIELVESLRENTTRGSGGFGSTGR